MVLVVWGETDTQPSKQIIINLRLRSEWMGPVRAQDTGEDTVACLRYRQSSPGSGCVLTTPRAWGLNRAPKNQTNSSNSKTIYKHSRGNVCTDYTAVSKGMKWGMFGKPSLVVQWLRLHHPNAGGPGSIPGQGTTSHIPQLKILPGATKTQHSQIKFLLNLIICFFALRLKTLSVNTPERTQSLSYQCHFLRTTVLWDNSH